MSEQSCQVQCNCAWNQETWANTADYQSVQCVGCNRIKEFRFKSFWKRLKDLFINSTLAIGLLALTACGPLVDTRPDRGSKEESTFNRLDWKYDVFEMSYKGHQFLTTGSSILHAPYCPCAKSP